MTALFTQKSIKNLLFITGTIILIFGIFYSGIKYQENKNLRLEVAILSNICVQGNLHALALLDQNKDKLARKALIPYLDHYFSAIGRYGYGAALNGYYSKEYLDKLFESRYKFFLKLKKETDYDDNVDIAPY